jgi:galacturonosyltransferase
VGVAVAILIFVCHWFSKIYFFSCAQFLTPPKAKTVFFENDTNRRIFIEEKILPQKQTVLLNGAGVNLQRYALKEYPAGDSVRFLFVGRVMQEKGVQELFAAMDRLHGEGADCTLDVLGYYEEDYAETIRHYEEKGWLHYHGYQVDVRPFIEQAHCFVLPSYHEGMANTNLECASMGRPLITSNIPGCKEAVVDGKSGLLCDAKNADSLYHAMSRFLKLSAREWENMGLAGRQHMEAVFDKRLVVAETIRSLESIDKRIK